MSFVIDIYLNEPCCTDVTKRVCFTCRSQIAERLYILARNLGVAGALCRAHEIGVAHRPRTECAMKRMHALDRIPALPGYESLAAILDEALTHAQSGKGFERHSSAGEAFCDQQIVQLGEWMSSTAFAIGQACKKSLESTRLPPERARAELLGAINYLAAAVIQIDRSTRR